MGDRPLDQRTFRHRLAAVQHNLVALGLVLGQLVLLSSGLNAAELSEIIDRGHLIVAVKDNLRPLGFRDANQQLQGLEIDIANRLAIELLDPELDQDEPVILLRPVANRDRLPALLNGEVDLVIASVTATPSRSRIVSFSTPYYLDGTTFVTQDPQIQRVQDIRQFPIALLSQSSTIATVRSLLPDVQLVGVDSYQAGLTLLETGDASVFAGDASVLAGWVQDHPNYRLLPTVISAEALAVVMPRGNQYDDLRREVNAAIARWYDEGWLQDRIDYWGLPQ